MAANQLKKSDIRVTRFRLAHEDLRDSGSGCLVYHIPTKQSFVSEGDQLFGRNKLDAMRTLCDALGVTVETLARQETTGDFPGWRTTQLYHRDYEAFSITVFFLQGEEDPELEGWTWGVDDDNGRWDYDPGVYETPEGAIRAAEKWATETLSKRDHAPDPEGERAAPTESPS